MIKLAIISDDPGRGGAYKVAADIVQGLDKNEYEAKWFFLCDQPEESPEGYYLGSPAIYIDYSLKSYMRLAFFPKTYETSYEPLNEALTSYTPDIIHFHTHATLLSLAKGTKKLLEGVKTIYTDHSQRIRVGEQPWVKQFLMSQVYKRLFSATRVVFVSEYAFNTAIKLGYGFKQKDTLITNSVDTKKFKPLDEADEKVKSINVIYLSRIHHAKGHHVLLDAWKLLPSRSELSLHFYGFEADGELIRQRVKREVFPNPVYYEGVTSTPEKVLQNAQIGVFPSFREGLPLALLEMMACGLPVVASDIPEIKGIITHGIDGLLFECGNSKDMAEKIDLLVQNENLRHIIGVEARKVAIINYGHSLSERYHHLYRSVNNIDERGK